MSQDSDSPIQPDKIVQQLQKDARDRLESYKQLRADIQGMSSTATSDDHTVSVTVAPGGSLQDLTLTQQALRHGPERLAGLILSTTRAATADGARRLAARVQETTEGDIDIVSIVEARLPDIDMPSATDRR